LVLDIRETVPQAIASVIKDDCTLAWDRTERATDLLEVKRE
jgi:hypothetical protein